jgi:uncharacterized membrane protein (UPF0127 family)
VPPDHLHPLPSRWAADRRTIRQVAGAAWVVLAIGLVVFLIRGANRPANPKLIPPGGVIPSRVVRDFGEVAFKVSGPTVPGPLAARRHCALLASTPAQQQKGLMNRHDLAGYEGMIFQFEELTTVPFFMRDTLIPLSIAWFDPTGKFLNTTTMLPCPKTSATCPTYSAISPYSVAIEVRAGGLPQLGIGPGAKIAVGGPC